MKKLILGAPGVGKSTYINVILSQLNSIGIPIIMGYSLNSLINSASFKLPQSYIVHYSLRRTIKYNGQDIFIDPFSDPVYNFLLKNISEIEIDSLVCSSRLIKQRILTRKLLEPQTSIQNNHSKILELFEEMCLVNLKELYSKAIKPFEDLNISVNHIISEANFNFIQIDKVKAFEILNDNSPVKYLPNQTKAITNLLPKSYQKLNSQKNESGIFERAGTFNFIAPYLHNSKSLLDIGCAEGFFCFKAETFGIKKILGTEIKKERYITANIHKELVGSNVEFKKIDLFTNPFNDKYEVVLLLNVLHQLKYPFSALAKIDEICERILIVEFPSLRDPKFLPYLPGNIKFDLNELPLIGIGSKTDQDQSFLFSPQAIKTFFKEHLTNYFSVDVRPSPFQDSRFIAICSK